MDENKLNEIQSRLLTRRWHVRGDAVMSGEELICVGKTAEEANRIVQLINDVAALLMEVKSFSVHKLKLDRQDKLENLLKEFADESNWEFLNTAEGREDMHWIGDFDPIEETEYMLDIGIYGDMPRDGGG